MPEIKTELQTQTQPQQPKIREIQCGDFGNGRYRHVQEELYSDCQRVLGFSKEQAHATCERLGADLGRLQAAKASVTFGKKVDRDGYRTVREVAKLKMPNSWALSVAVICNGIFELQKQGLDAIENSIKNDLLEYVNDHARRIKHLPK